MAFDSVEHIMRDVNYGWLLRYAHANGASMFFIVVYIHIFRGLYYGSYKAPRELLWMLGVVIMLLMMATAFMGYVLPWGQMSFWGATVITNLFSAIPFVGEAIVTWLWGGFSVDNPTLNRFYALHYLMPFVLFAVVFLHILALHQFGSNNPVGIDLTKKDKIPFHPYYTIKDTFGLSIFLIIFAFFVFYAPNYLGHPDNYIPANPLSTPAHIVPEWYFLPFYAILRSTVYEQLFAPLAFLGWFGISAKLAGVLAMFGSIAVLFVLPWLDTSKVRSATFRPIYKWFFWLLVIDCVILTWVGGQVPNRDGGLDRPVRDALLLRPLPGHPAAAGQARAAAAGADQHRQARARSRPRRAAGGVSVMRLRTCADRRRVACGVASRLGHRPPKATSSSSIASGRPRACSAASTAPPAQRGFQVYREVCAACHGLKYVAFRNLETLGYSEDDIKAIAAEYTITDGPNDEGEMFERPGQPFDRVPEPVPQRGGCRRGQRRQGAARPVADRQGPHGRRELPLQPADRLRGAAGRSSRCPDGGYYNAYFPGHVIAMPPPLERRSGHLCRRDQCHVVADVAGRRPVPDVGGRAQAGGAQGHRPQGDPVPDRAHRPDLRAQAQDLGRRAALSGAEIRRARQQSVTLM